MPAKTDKYKESLTKENESVPSIDDMKDDSDTHEESNSKMTISKDMLRECMKEMQMEDRLKWKLDGCSKEELEKIIEMAQEKIKNGDCKCESTDKISPSKY